MLTTDATLVFEDDDWLLRRKVNFSETSVAERVWRAVIFEIAAGLGETSTLMAAVDEVLATPFVLGHRDWNQDRRCWELKVLISASSEERVQQITQLTIQRLTAVLKPRGCPLNAGLGTGVSGPGGIRKSFQQARWAAGYGVIRGAGIYVYQNDPEVSGFAASALASYAERFEWVLRTGGEWSTLIAEYFEVLSKSLSSARRLLQEVQRLFSIVADLIPPSAELDRYYHIVDFVAAPEELRSQLADLCSRATIALGQRSCSLADRKVREFQDWIADRYGDGALSTTSVSLALQISPSYLGKILKKHLGTTFVDYLTEVRMTKAQELLATTDRMAGEIAELVGYPYTHYFSATFKKKVGVTPSEYRALGRCRRQQVAEGLQTVDASGVLSPNGVSIRRWQSV